MKAQQQLIAYYTLVRREVCRFLRIWPQTLLPPLIITTLYLAIFGKLIGSRLEMVGWSITYIEFIVPGLILMSVITSSYENTVSSFFIAKFQRSIEEVLVSPISGYLVIMGYITGGICRGLLTGLLVYSVAGLFVHFDTYNMFLAITISFIVALTFSLIGLINAFFAQSFDNISWVTTFILTPLTFLGGVFYDINLLPEFWQKVSLLNPVFHMINLFRYAIIGYNETGILYYVLYIMILFAISLFYFAHYLFNKGIGLKQ